MKRLGVVAALLGILFAVPPAADAQVRGVYWTTSGFFGPFNIQDLIPSIPKDKARDITIPVSMWIIDHPKGLIVFDTGNNVAISDGGCKQYWVPANCDGLKPSQKRDDVIDRQLTKAGFSADQVKIVDHLALAPGPHRQHQDVPQGDPRDPEERAVPGVVAGEVPGGRRHVRDGRLRRSRPRLQLHGAGRRLRPVRGRLRHGDEHPGPHARPPVGAGEAGQRQDHRS